MEPGLSNRLLVYWREQLPLLFTLQLQVCFFIFTAFFSVDISYIPANTSLQTLSEVFRISGVLLWFVQQEGKNRAFTSLHLFSRKCNYHQESTKFRSAGRWHFDFKKQGVAFSAFFESKAICFALISQSQWWFANTLCKKINKQKFW